MGLILRGSSQMPYYTDMSLVFKSLQGKQNEYNWLITDIELNYYPIDIFNSKIIWISGEELTEVVNKYDIQFIWAVLSGFSKDINIDINNLSVKPIADGNPKLWVLNPQIQHPLAAIEIVCWDSSATILLTEEREINTRFKSYFRDSICLTEFTGKCP